MAEGRLDFQPGEFYGFPQDARIMKCEDQNFMDYEMMDPADKMIKETNNIVSQIRREKATRSY